MTALVCVQRCADSPVPAVPSDVVRCSECGEDCWISKRTGSGTRQAAELLSGDGNVLIVCVPCILLHPKVRLVTTQAAAEEFSQLEGP